MNNYGLAFEELSNGEMYSSDEISPGITVTWWSITVCCPLTPGSFPISISFDGSCC